MEETVHLDGLVIDKQIIGLTTKEESFAFINVPFEGILGLSFHNPNQPHSKPVFDSIVERNLIKRKIFAFSFGLLDNFITIGYVDKTKMRTPFFFTDVISDHFWEIDLLDISIGGQVTDFCDELRKETGRCGAAVDSGTALYAVPPVFMNTINQAINVNDNCDGFGSLPDISISFRTRSDYFGFQYVTKEIVLKPEDYIIDGDRIKEEYEKNSVDNFLLDKGNSMTCKLAIMPLEVPKPRGPIFILGGFFLKKFYTVFDREKKVLGFAEAGKADGIIDTPYD